jgi:serine/threonine protein kinase
VTDILLDNLKVALGDAYLIERELTGGGMSRVFVAREHALGREVVIKVLPPELAAGINRERFRREVQLAARLSHPYIVTLLSAGESGELLWFTMPYIPGESLRSRLEKNGPLGVREVIQLLRDVLEALAYAHDRGVIHRDIKPANILSDGTHGLVTDFGVAKALGAALPMTGVAGHTTSGVAIGTPAYMAPEQLAADPAADHRVDLYAVGLLAYELLAGASPFAAPSPTATMTAQLTRTPESLTKVRPEVPLALAQLVDRCLAKTPDGRPATAHEMLGDLDRISGALAADVHRSANSGDYPALKHRYSRWPLAAAAAIIISFAVLSAWWLSRGKAQAPMAAAPETVLVQAGSDSLEGAELPQRAMTRADSMAIAQALQDEIAQLNPQPRAASRALEIVAESDDPLEVQLQMMDSLVRIRLGEITNRATALTSSGVRAGLNAIRAPGSAPRRVVIINGPSRSRDSSLQAVNEAVTREISGRLSRQGGWQVIESDQVDRGRGEIPAEVMVTVGLSKLESDSAVLRINVRNLMPGSSFGYNVLSSKPVGIPAQAEDFRATVREAIGMLEGLKHLPQGQTWMMDMGRRERTGEGARPEDDRR